jgi:hypothetical protein
MRTLDVPLEDLLKSLRLDVQEYLLHHAARLAYCREKQERERWVERDFHKKELSKLCGWDAGEQCDEVHFYNSCVYLARMLRLV